MVSSQVTHDVLKQRHSSSESWTFTSATTELVIKESSGLKAEDKQVNSVLFYNL